MVRSRWAEGLEEQMWKHSRKQELVQMAAESHKGKHSLATNVTMTCSLCSRHDICYACIFNSAFEMTMRHWFVHTVVTGPVVSTACALSRSHSLCAIYMWEQLESVWMQREQSHQFPVWSQCTANTWQYDIKHWQTQSLDCFCGLLLKISGTALNKVEFIYLYHFSSQLIFLIRHDSFIGMWMNSLSGNAFPLYYCQVEATVFNLCISRSINQSQTAFAQT